MLVFRHDLLNYFRSLSFPKQASSFTIRSKTFDAFLSMASEKEVEELLTYHARVKKSIDMFFGSPSEKKITKDEEKDVDQVIALLDRRTDTPS